MACNSVATSKASISQIYLGQDELVGMLAKLLDIDPSAVNYHHLDQGAKGLAHGGSTIIMEDDYSHARHFSMLPGIDKITIAQFANGGEISLKLAITGSSQSAVNALQEQLSANYEKLQVVAQQKTILKRLAQLGKLSNVQQKENGVTARFEIAI